MSNIKQIGIGFFLFWSTWLLANNALMTGVLFERLENPQGKILENGYLIFQQGRIIEVGESAERLEKIKKLNPKIQWIPGKAPWILPGFVLPWSEMGVTQTNDSFAHPHQMTVEGFHPFLDSYEEFLDAGFTTVCLIPSGSGFVGEGVLIQPEVPSKILKEDAVAVLRFQIGELDRIQQVLHSLKDKKIEDFSQAPYKPYLPYGKALLQQKGWITEITAPHLVPLFLPYCSKVKPTLLLRGRAYQVQELLKTYEGMFLLTPEILYEPISEFIRVSVLEFAKPNRIIGLLPERDTISSCKSYRLDCIRLEKYGYPRQEILAGMTLSNAKILQLEKEVGSLERGKKANFLVFNGDPFALSTRLNFVFLEGKLVALHEKRNKSQ